MVDATLERVVAARVQEVGPLRRETSAFLDASADVAFREKLLLVVSELCTNAIEALGNPSEEFTVRIRDQHDCVVIEVEDTGPGFSDAFSKPGADDNTERGRGLAIVRSVVDDLLVLRRRGKTLVRCVMNR